MKFGLLCALCAALLCAPAMAQVPAAVAAPTAVAPTLDDFLEKPAVGAAHLSPDGRYLAYVLRDDSGSTVVVTTLANFLSKAILVLPGKAVTVDWLDWKDNTRLIVGASALDIVRRDDQPTGDIVSFRYGQYLIALDRDGGNETRLIKGDFWNPDRARLADLIDRLPNDPDHILAAAPDVSGNAAVWKVDIRTGDAVMVEKGDPEVDAWETDSTGAVVARIRSYNRTVFIEGRAPGESRWTTIAALHPKDLKVLDDFSILGAAEKPSQFYVAVKPKDASEGDTRRLRIYDVATKTLSDPIWPATKYDISDIVYDGDSTRLAGVCYVADFFTCDFKDPKINANYRGLLGFFGGDDAVTPIAINADANWWLLGVSGPDEPASYYLYDVAHAKVERLADRRPKLAAAELAVMQRYAYTTRDGASIPAYLTRPRGAPNGPLPMIVMPHGGPEARDDFEFDLWSQFLSTRGYLVFQPNFRGSGGYGRAYAEAGYRQWGGRMADDITDGVHKLIETGQADPKRICIFGASYGGYAALYAGATHPELYQCVASWAGISDMNAMMRAESRDDGKDSAAYRYWLKSAGDPDKDAAALTSASPVTYAATYRPPVLLIHGEADDIVDVEQSRIMERALKRAGRDVKLITFPNQGHPHWEAENEKTALTDLLDFIEAHIAPAKLSPPPPTSPAG